MSIKIGIVGIGKIARDQHLPVIAANPDFELKAVASPNSTLDGTHTYASLDEMLAKESDLDAVALCTPPQPRHALAKTALEAGKAVLLEKPPGATLSEVEALRRISERTGAVLFATWHSRYAPGVAPARAWLAERRVRKVRVEWREDVRRWHPGQAWIWEAGGLGVFDPGINALSLVTAILPEPFFLTKGELHFPENRDAPIAAELDFTDDQGADIHASFDWLQTGPQTWDVTVETDQGALKLSMGGSELAIDGQAQTLQVPDPLHVEYDGIYRRFADLVRGKTSDVDVSPLRHAADAFLRGRHVDVARFDD